MEFSKDFLKRKLNVNFDEMSLMPNSIVGSLINSGAITNKPTEETDTGITPAEEEWIWVEGYKGTDKNMCCRDYQFALNEQFDMPEDAEIVECHSGFHLCPDLTDVYDYYEIGDGNRFFKVSALVRKSDYEKTNKSRFIWGRYEDKLVSKSIIFTRELTPDEILAHITTTKDFTEDQKKEALATSINKVYNKIKYKKLEELGYSEAFAHYVVNNDGYDTAVAVASQPGLSMDVKALFIMRDIHDN